MTRPRPPARPSDSPVIVRWYLDRPDIGPGAHSVYSSYEIAESDRSYLNLPKSALVKLTSAPPPAPDAERVAELEREVKRLRKALAGVIRVADRDTDEFNEARAALKPAKKPRKTP